MDKNSILKFFNDNTDDMTENKRQQAVQVINQGNGNVVIQYGRHASVTNQSGCSVNDNVNLTQADKDEVHALIKQLEDKNKK